MRSPKHLLRALLVGLVAGPFTLQIACLADSAELPAHSSDAPSVATANNSPFLMLTRACPTNGIQYSELEAGRIVNGKLALAKAIREAAKKRGDDIAYGTRDELTGDYVFARTPNQVAQVFRRGLGGDNFLARGMDAVAAITHVTTQVPLDGVSTVTGKIIETGGRVLRIHDVPQLKLKSQITSDKAGVILSTRW